MLVVLWYYTTPSAHIIIAPFLAIRPLSFYLIHFGWDKMTNLISIIMPAFAVEKHITYFERAIEGIVNQTHKDWELIIACDGGFKTTIAAVQDVLDKYKDGR